MSEMRETVGLLLSIHDTESPMPKVTSAVTNGRRKRFTTIAVSLALDPTRDNEINPVVVLITLLIKLLETRQANVRYALACRQGA